MSELKDLLSRLPWHHKVIIVSVALIAWSIVVVGVPYFLLGLRGYSLLIASLMGVIVVALSSIVGSEKDV